ncbi:hypothetical protein Nepgr_015624 [Nepenthes gracilis]|uniref:TRF2/HOY1 PH-like domain-containing protein n=1 Tax=Nepenthes gracilis TaxID=150966 RepID=A0AAD3XQV3_NEPGR|nr:hypothetical protein Nepgr_015624 [Nepenthes gracilis]
MSENESSKFMVHFAGGGSLRRQPETMPLGDSKIPVKLEIEDSLEEEHGPFNKKMKQSSFPDHLSTGNNMFPVPPPEYNPLDEPSPLGLRLRKSPSLLELIQMRLSEGNASKLGSAPSYSFNSKEKSTARGTSGTAEKMKAANFPASFLKIGCWEYASRYEGDLVAKCYFAKHKLVWEILDGALKSKIEIQWSDIMGLKANLPEDGPGTLTVTLARQPLFFRETNPQPRKHTLWQATADFTDGQASIHRQHFLQVPHGLLNKHFEKLIDCDMRLNFLSRQPEISLDSPYFEVRSSILNDLGSVENHDQRESSRGPNTSAFQDAGSPAVSQSSSINIRQGSATENLPHEALSPSSVMDTRAIEGNGSGEADSLKSSKNWEQLIMQGLCPSLSMTDLVNHIGNCISGQVSSENPSLTTEGSESCRLLKDVAQQLLGDSQLTICSDEKSLMSRVNSLCCLLQQDNASVQGVQFTGKSGFEETEGGKDGQVKDNTQGNLVISEGERPDFSNSKQAPTMSRKDSYGELLLHLPRITSLPKFLFDISEDAENQTQWSSPLDDAAGYSSSGDDTSDNHLQPTMPSTTVAHTPSLPIAGWNHPMPLVGG